MSEASADTLNIAMTAFADLQVGLSGGDWAPFLAQLSDDFTFWFPAGPFKGWHQGRDRARDFFQSVGQVFPGGLTLTLQQITTNATTVVFEVRSQGSMLGNPYENQAALTLEVRDGKICAYREYLGVIFQLS